MQDILNYVNRWHVVGFIAIYVCHRISYQLLLWPYFLSPLKQAPGPPLGNPLIGHMSNILRSEAGILQREWAKVYGPSIRAVGPIGIERMIFLSPNALHKILISDWINYPRPEFVKKILGFSVGFGLLTVTGDEHRKMRKAMNPAFSISNLTAQTEKFYDPIYSLVKILNSQINATQEPLDGKVFLVYDWMSKTTLDIICLTAFGYQTDSLHNPKNELADAYHQLNDLQNGKNISIFALLMMIPGFLPLIKKRWLYDYRHWLRTLRLGRAASLIESMHRIKTVSAGIFHEKISRAVATESNTESNCDIMSLLAQAQRNENGQGYRISDDAMVDQVLTFLSAGHETVACGLAWTLWLLATHPHIQTKLRAEIVPLIKHNPTPNFGNLRQMAYLESVIMESLRVFPPVPMTVRIADKSDFIDDIWVPKGTLLYIGIRVVNTYKGIWGEDAEEFRPERWNELPNTYHPILSLQTFIAGPHHCIGRTMAIVEMKAVLAVLIANFEFTMAYEGQKAQPTAAVTMKPADNLPLRVRAIAKA